MVTYWLTTPSATRKSISLDAIDRAVDELPRGTEWRIEKQWRPGGKLYRLRSGVGPPQLRMAG